jgi:hypothetical protein
MLSDSIRVGPVVATDAFASKFPPGKPFQA